MSGDPKCSRTGMGAGGPLGSHTVAPVGPQTDEPTAAQAEPSAGNHASEDAKGGPATEASGKRARIAHTHDSLGAPIPGLELGIAGDALRVWQRGEQAPLLHSSSEEIAHAFVVWMEGNLPVRRFVTVDELGLLYNVFCKVTWRYRRYELSPLILKHMGKLTVKRQKELREKGKVYRNRIHYLVGPTPKTNPRE